MTDPNEQEYVSFADRGLRRSHRSHRRGQLREVISLVAERAQPVWFSDHQFELRRVLINRFSRRSLAMSAIRRFADPTRTPPEVREGPEPN